MRKYNYITLLLLTFSLSFYSVDAFAKGEGKSKVNIQRFAKTSDNPSASVVDINNITCWVNDAGFHDWVIASSWNGQFPKGSGVGAIFAEGILWGGQVHDGQDPLVRVNGNEYGGTTVPVTRLYRVRPDYQTADLTDDAANFNTVGLGAVTPAMIQAVYDQYATDWNEWPAKTANNPGEGALFNDVNGDGVYDPAVDIPGIPGASQTLFIKYTDGNNTSLWGAPPIGFVVTETYWAYAYSGALGNVIYKKVDIVYKGTPKSAPDSRIDSLYIMQWADPDVGSSTNDYAGCDTTLNLGYAYTAGTTDASYNAVGLPSPAIGYDFLQGVSQYTGNPSDSAIFNLKWRKGYKYVNRKPMSSFIYFAAGGAWSDPGHNYNGALQFYNLMRGRKPLPAYPSGDPFPSSVADVNDLGTFLLTGDPVTGTGKIDGAVDGPGDRRILVINGPITMHLGDTAQVVLALVGGIGTDNLSSITAMKTNDATAQIVYDQLFKLPQIAPPSVDVSELDQKVVLSWGGNVASVDKIEHFSDQGYNFEGYNVYQLKSPSANINNPNEAIKLATYDLVNGITNILDTVITADGVALPEVVENGKDAGISRSITITKDAFTKAPLRNGQEYYFVVISYAYNPAPLLPFHSLRSAVVVKKAVPQTPVPGVRYPDATQVINATHTAGQSDGTVTAYIIQPDRVTGQTYQVKFKDDPNLGLTWGVYVGSTPKLENQTNQSGDNNYLFVDGLQIKVQGPPYKGVDWSSTGTRWLSGDPNNGGDLMFGSVFLGANFWGETTVAPADLRSLHVEAYKVQSYVDANGNGKYDIGEIYTVDPAKGQYANLYTTWGAGHWEKTALIPFKFFAIEPDGSQRQVDVIVRDRDANGQWDPDNGDNIRFNYIFVLNTTYDPTGNDWNPTAGGRDFMAEILENGGPVLWVAWWYPRGTREQFSSDFTMDFIAPKVLTSADVFTFTAPSVTNDPNLAKDDVDKINVFPNPYYGYQNRETSRSDHYVTFSHLPANATIRIFDLAGVLVKTIKKSDPTQFTTWNLQNNDNYPVASGIYIVHIDMPDLGKTKILKLAVVQEQQILRVY
ncbi:T9SS type A sorting domain-containing protein [Melioribacteraceae bacterium 4301-Me]|uniref:T9SS type A sorting domain-containing protein n=1 Tax=Pyranulibacter aquaticus TaxID=3163344 RepID=UPI003597D739